MAKSAKTAWGIDSGNCALKAIKLGLGDDGVEVLDFAVIKHKKILSQPDINAETRDELITEALNKFLEEHDVSNANVVVSVPGQNSFARFIKLPPVEDKRIPEIVRYEAIQQIPRLQHNNHWFERYVGLAKKNLNRLKIKRTIIKEGGIATFSVGHIWQRVAPVGRLLE